MHARTEELQRVRHKRKLILIKQCPALLYVLNVYIINVNVVNIYVINVKVKPVALEAALHGVIKGGQLLLNLVLAGRHHSEDAAGEAVYRIARRRQGTADKAHIGRLANFAVLANENVGGLVGLVNELEDINK